MKPNLKSSGESQNNFLLDVWKNKIQLIKINMEIYKEYIIRYQVSVNRKMELHTQSKMNIKYLKARLRVLQHCCTENKRRTVEQALQLQTEKADLIEKELIKFNNQTKDADSNVELCMKQVNQLSELLSQGDKQKELKAATLNLRYVKGVSKRSTRKVPSADHKIVQLEQRLKETDRRAYQAELNIKQLHNDFINLQQCLERHGFHFR